MAWFRVDVDLPSRFFCRRWVLSAVTRAGSPWNVVVVVVVVVVALIVTPILPRAADSAVPDFPSLSRGPPSAPASDFRRRQCQHRNCRRQRKFRVPPPLAPDSCFRHRKRRC